MQLAPHAETAPLQTGLPASSGAARELSSTLGALADAVDEIAGAVERHEHDLLVDATQRTTSLLEQLDARTRALPAEESLDLRRRVAPLVERIRAGLRRNAYLIERAWAIDAETMRLLAGLGRVGTDGVAVPYGEGSTSTGYSRKA